MDVRSKTSRRYNSCPSAQNTCGYLGLILVTALMACRPAEYGLELSSAKFFQSNDDTAPVVFKLDGTDEVKIPAGSFLIVEFNQLLDGDVIEEVECERTAAGTCRVVGEEQYKGRIPVVKSFKTHVGVVTVSVADALVSYRPDGGYNPDPATIAAAWPRPGIRIDFPTLVAVGTSVNVVLTTQIKNPDGKALAAPKTITFKVIP